MALPFTYVEIGSYKIPVAINVPVTGASSGIMMMSCSGLMTVGENQSDSRVRTFSSGTVLDPNPVFAGKELVFELLFYGSNQSTVKNNFNNFQLSLMVASTAVKTNFPHNYTTQFQRIDLDEQSWNRSGVGGRIKATVYFTTEEAF